MIFLHLVAALEIVLALIGIALAYKSQRICSYRLKLIGVYLILLTHGTLSFFNLFAHEPLQILYIIFIYSFVILHWRESTKE